MRLWEGRKDVWASLRPGDPGYTFDEELVRGCLPVRPPARPPARRQSFLINQPQWGGLPSPFSLGLSCMLAWLFP